MTYYLFSRDVDDGKRDAKRSDIERRELHQQHGFVHDCIYKHILLI